MRSTFPITNNSRTTTTKKNSNRTHRLEPTMDAIFLYFHFLIFRDTSFVCLFVFCLLFSLSASIQHTFAVYPMPCNEVHGACAPSVSESSANGNWFIECICRWLLSFAYKMCFSLTQQDVIVFSFAFACIYTYIFFFVPLFRRLKAFPRGSAVFRTDSSLCVCMLVQRVDTEIKQNETKRKEIRFFATSVRIRNNGWTRQQQER